jgi:uncharacterized protein involved in exopolysaccharide biosynthesis
MSPESVYPVPRSPLPTIVSELRPAEAKSHFALTIFKWYPLILVFGLVLTVVAAIAMLLKPTLPSATAKILIKAGPDSLPITGVPTSAGRATPDFLQTEVELLASRIVLLPVARALREERGETVQDSELEADVSTLRANLAVMLIPNTTMIQARRFAPTEAEAQRVLGMIIESYVEQHATAYTGTASFWSFFERETGTAAANLKDAENRLQRWREENNVVAAEDELLAQLAAVSELEGGLRRAETDIEATRAQIDGLLRDIAALPREALSSREQMANPVIAKLRVDIATEEAMIRDVNRGPLTDRLRAEITAAEVAARDASSNPLVAKLKADLATADLALNDLRQRYHDEDRRVQEKLEQTVRVRNDIAAAERDAIAAATERAQSLRRELASAQSEVERAARDRIAGLRAQLAAAERERDVFARETISPNPLREMLHRDLVTARMRLTTLASQRDGVRGQLAEARTALAHLKDARIEADRLGREVEMARALYVQNTKRLDDARLTVGLRKHQLTNIAVIEPPRATPASRSLKQVVLVSLLGGLVGIGLGMATALALDFFNWSLRTPEDVEFYLGVPALAAVPAISASARRLPALPGPDDREVLEKPRVSAEPDRKDR